MTVRHNCDYLSLVAIRLRLKTTSEVEERVCVAVEPRMQTVAAKPMLAAASSSQRIVKYVYGALMRRRAAPAGHLRHSACLNVKSYFTPHQHYCG
jgi:hypothetical protein